MIRAICYWCSVRSELGRRRMSRDIFKVVIDPNRPDAGLYRVYNEWTDVHQQLYGVRPPSDEMRASIHAPFVEQRRHSKKFDMICQLYDLSADKPGAGMETYEWLITQIDWMILREREEWNINLREGPLNQRARQTRLGGGGGNGNDNRRGLNGKAAAAE
eukprot:9022211-Pyramimonas_sp.AAC.1